MFTGPADQSAEIEPPFKDGSTSFGSFYPKHYVLAVFNREDDAHSAGDDLRRAGFADDDVIVAPGAEVVAHAAAAKADQGLMSRFAEQWSKLYTDESADANTLVDFARTGAAFVLAYAPEEAETARAAEALRARQPVALRKYNALTITELG